MVGKDFVGHSFFHSFVNKIHIKEYIRNAVFLFVLSHVATQFIASR